MIPLPGGDTVYADSTGRPIEAGDRIRFRGKEFTLKGFGPNEETYGVATLLFEEEITHTPEVPHECNVDKIV